MGILFISASHYTYFLLYDVNFTSILRDRRRISLNMPPKLFSPHLRHPTSTISFPLPSLPAILVLTYIRSSDPESRQTQEWDHSHPVSCGETSTYTFTSNTHSSFTPPPETLSFTNTRPASPPTYQTISPHLNLKLR